MSVEDDVQVQWLCRTLPDGERRAVSVFLINRISSSNPGRPDDSEWLFQPRLSVRHHDDAAAFQPRSLNDVVDFESLDADRRSDELLFRDQPEYAVGHGCAADWDAEGGAGATVVRTVVLPVHELPRIDPRGSDGLSLDMRLLGGPGPEGVTGERLQQMLYPLADAYGRWIDELGSRASELHDRLREHAAEHLDACRLVHDRIVEGIELLSRSEDDASRLARRAFCFANRAMALQRARSEVSLRRRRGEPLGDPDDVPASWRPFPVGVHTDESSSTRRPGPPEPEHLRPVVVPDRRRQDGGLSGLDRVRASPPPDPGFRVRSSSRWRCRRAHAVHAPAPHGAGSSSALLLWPVRASSCA